MRARAGTGDAGPVGEREQRPVAGAEDVLAAAGQEPVVKGGERPAGVRTAVDIAGHQLATAHDETGEQGLADAEPKSLAARIVDLGQGAEPDARPRAGGIRGCQE